jgi:hypothetical protein
MSDSPHNECESNSTGAASQNSPGNESGRGGEICHRDATPLQRKARLLKNWNWGFVSKLNERLCASGKAAYGYNQENKEATEADWNNLIQQELSPVECFVELRIFHKRAPFLNFNGNTFSALGKLVAEGSLGQDIHSRTKLVFTESLVGHFIAGVIDYEEMERGIASTLSPVSPLKVGDHVETLKGTIKAVVISVEPDQTVWIKSSSGLKSRTTQESLKVCESPSSRYIEVLRQRRRDARQLDTSNAVVEKIDRTRGGAER